jgi:maleate isomerase
MLPRGVALHTARVMQVIETEEELLQMAEYAERAGRELASANVNMILYGCTSGSFLKGEGWNRQFTKELGEVVERPVVTTATAVIAALKRLRIDEVCLATPYPEETNAKAVAWLESVNVKVVKTIELIKSTYSEPISNLEIGSLTPERVYNKIRQYAKVLAVPFFISCTNLRTIEIIELLETDLDLPVVTSNQASLWAALRTLKLRCSLKGFGRLLSEQYM